MKCLPSQLGRQQGSDEKYALINNEPGIIYNKKDNFFNKENLYIVAPASKYPCYYVEDTRTIIHKDGERMWAKSSWLHQTKLALV